MTSDQVQSTFAAMSPEDQKELRSGLDEELRRQNIFLQERLDVLYEGFLRLKPVVPAAHKGRVTCLVCHAEGKKREFRHLAACLWFKLMTMYRKSQQDA